MPEHRRGVGIPLLCNGWILFIRQNLTNQTVSSDDCCNAWNSELKAFKAKIMKQITCRVSQADEYVMF